MKTNTSSYIWIYSYNLYCKLQENYRRMYGINFRLMPESSSILKQNRQNISLAEQTIQTLIKQEKR